MARACLCGAVGCTRHGRKSSSRRPGSYAGQYQTNRAALIKVWLADPNTRCVFCGQRAKVDDPWSPDHKVPHIDGGSDHISNLQPAHLSCNKAAGARLRKERAKAKAEERARLRLVDTARYLEEVRR